MRFVLGLLVLMAACGSKSAAVSDGGGGAGTGGVGTVGGGGGGGGAGGGLSGVAGIGGGGSGGAIVDASSQDRPVDASSDVARPTPKLKWTGTLPSWNLDYISGAIDGEIWVAARPSSVAQIRADGTIMQSSLALSGSAYVTGLWVAGPNNAYASALANIVLHWDGSGTWKRDIMRSGLTFKSIWGTGPTNIYAVGGNNPFHSTGDDQWMEQPLPATTFAGPGPLGGTGPTDIWLAGIYGEIFRSTGDGTWHQETTPQTPGVNQLWVASANEAYMVSNVVIMHRLPSTGGWVAEPNPLGISVDRDAGSDYFNWIWGSGPNDVYVTTDKGHLLHSIGDGVWQDEGFESGTSFSVDIRCIWGRSASDVYLATSNGIFHGVP